MRAPTEQELREIAEYFDPKMESGTPPEDLMAGARICVWDNYTSDGPGYCGKVAMILWPGGPECADVMIWRPVMKQVETGEFRVEAIRGGLE
jgi:hypothetical protein